ncbi:hypothetical protein NXC12_PD00427 (plasmid) [Rhizobium etli]|uniref:Uncharacterized protein n=1 Tax=Rhizobium etli TaxID=29449 RepID=A0AAN1BLN1_RHIET|nr:hypothetical protein NXC12_PD00427 [Rhizobium etli]
MVAGSLQVNLCVRVAEVSRSAMNELGINLSAFNQLGNFKLGLLHSGGIDPSAGPTVGETEIGFSGAR